MKYFLLLNFLLLHITTDAQVVHWTKNSQGLTFVADFDTTQYGPDPEDFYYTYIKIYILNQATQKWIQVFKQMELPGTPSYFKPEWILEIEDLNFDGYADFSVLTGYYINGAQTDCDCYLWNPKQVKFVKDTVISGLEGLHIDHKKNVLHFSWRYGFEVLGHCVYQWQGDKFVEVAFEESTSWPPKGGQVVTRNLINGIMTETITPGEDWSDIEHQPDECDLW